MISDEIKEKFIEFLYEHGVYEEFNNKVLSSFKSMDVMMSSVYSGSDFVTAGIFWGNDDKWFKLHKRWIKYMHGKRKGLVSKFKLFLLKYNALEEFKRAMYSDKTFEEVVLKQITKGDPDKIFTECITWIYNPMLWPELDEKWRKAYRWNKFTLKIRKTFKV